MTAPTAAGLQAPAPAVAPGLASWLGAVLVLILCLNTLGGWVRLSGSGLAIPQWPVLTLADGRRTLLPPMSEQDWVAAAAAHAADQERLRALALQGAVDASDLGRTPASMADFQAMWWTEWSHRVFAALVGIVVFAATTATLRHPGARRIIGLPMGLAAGLVVVQGLVGGLLVHHGSGTRWLFLHQANAGAIVGLVLWALLRLLASGSRPVVRHPALTPALALLGCVWLQLVAGAMVAGSASKEGTAGFAAAWAAWPWQVWDAGRGPAWNLLDNPHWHHWLHGWLVVALLMTALATAAAAWRRPTGPRARMALGLAGTFIGIQALLGMMTVGRHEPFTCLAHQFAAMCLLCAAVLAVHDLRHESAVAEPEGVPA
ncbi:MAG: hypothetical protein RLZZ127_1051 [Planctomycetota bacterium]